MATTPSNASPKTRVICFERVVDHGTQRVDWTVELQGVWRNVKDVGVTVETDARRPTQCIWQRIVEVTAPVGTLFERTVVQPLESRPKAVMGYLEAGTRSTRGRILRTRHRLAPDGKLVRVDPPDTKS